jgi:glycerol uptake facilitator-like aquaporin
MDFTKAQKYFAEAFGTCLFFFFIQLSTEEWHVPMGLFLCLVLFGNISGGHFNPSVTLCMILYKDQPIGEGLLYILSQIIGGFFGNNIIL